MRIKSLFLILLALVSTGVNAAWEKTAEGQVLSVHIRKWENNNIVVKLSNMYQGCNNVWFGAGEEYFSEYYSTLLAALHAGTTVTIWGDPNATYVCVIEGIEIEAN